MNKFVKMSERSKQLMGQLLEANINDPALTEWNQAPDNCIDMMALIFWLCEFNQFTEEQRLSLEALRTSLLGDLRKSLPPVDETIDTNGDLELETNPGASPDLLNRLKLHLLLLAGGILAMYAGFSGITAILSLLFQSPAVIVGGGVVGALFSMVFFYQFERVMMSKKMGSELAPELQLLDICIQQVEQLKQLNEVVDKLHMQFDDVETLNKLQMITQMLDKRFEALNDVRESYNSKLDDPYVKVAKYMSSFVQGGLVASGGFLAGQALSLNMTLLFVTGITATSWPILLAGVILGLASLGLYFGMQSTSYEKQVSSLLGVDPDKINAFGGRRAADRERGKFIEVNVKVVEKLHRQQRMDELEQRVQDLELERALRQQAPQSHGGLRLFDLQRSRSAGNLRALAEPVLQLEGVAHIPGMRGGG